MSEFIGRKVLTRWHNLDATALNDVNAALEKHGLTVFFDPNVGVSPGVCTVADDPQFAEMEALATKAPVVSKKDAE